MSKKSGLDLLREPFPEHHIGKLPKPTARQTEEVKKNFKAGVRCVECGGWHHPKVVHLDYVGHAPLTDRFLNADQNWTWEPLAFNEQGLPAFDNTGGLWIKLTICGVTRIGYGNAPAKGEAGNREKEVIGDALRNAGMRFGAALDLWHKGVLHIEAEIESEIEEPTTKMPTRASVNNELKGMETIEEFNTYAKSFQNTHGKGVWSDLSGKMGNKTETWKNVFDTQKNRITGVSPIDNRDIEQIKTDWKQMADNCSDLITVDVLETDMDKNLCLDTVGNREIIGNLKKEFE